MLKTTIRKRIRCLLLATSLAGGTVFDLGSCFQDWVEKAVERQECIEEYGHKPDFVEELCF